jgi:hypothetical protein
MDPESSAAWNKWADKRILDFIKIHDECIFEDVKKAFLEAREISRTELKAAIAELRAEQEARLAQSDEAVVSLLLEIERRIGALEERATPKPRLIAGRSVDAA